MTQPEQATETITLKASPEVIEALKDWSTPVQVRITGTVGAWEMEIRHIHAAPTYGPIGGQRV